MLTQFNVGRSKKLWVSNGFNTVLGVGEELRRYIVSRALTFFWRVLKLKALGLQNCPKTFIHDCKNLCSRMVVVTVSKLPYISYYL